MLESAAQRLASVLAAGPDALARAGAPAHPAAPARPGVPAPAVSLAHPAHSARHVAPARPLTDGRLLRLADEVLANEMQRYPDGRMLIWDIARHDGYTIPPYPMAGCGDVREFLSDEGARDVPDWYERHLGIGRDTYARMYELELVMVRNRARWRRVWAVPAATMSPDARAALGGSLWRALAEWLAFALSTATNADDPRLFKR